MKVRLLLFFGFFISGFHLQAQVTGSDTVCAGSIYSYSVTIPGAVTYTWTVPANWYAMTGQGTSQITISCNFNAGQVCAEGFDSLGQSLGSQCLNTILGSTGGGGGSWSLWPTGTNLVCDNVFGVNITPIITFLGGGNCPSGCGSGGSNANAVYALYQGQTFIGEIGSVMTLGMGSYYAAYVDTTNGANFPQAVQIVSGCGGGGGGNFSIAQVGLWTPSVSQLPSPVCIGDTVTLLGSGAVGGWWGPPWYIGAGLVAVTSLWDGMQLQAIVTATGAYVNYTTTYTIQSGFSDGTVCSAGTSYNVNQIYCSPVPSFQTASPSICENSCISFSNFSLHATNYQWSFPGAIPSNSTDTNPTNICYANAGTYDVTLISGNAMYSDTLLLPGYITVSTLPQPSFSASQTIFCAGDCIGFSNASSNTTSFSWNFPGANPVTSADTNPQNICYNSPGNFDVGLICWNAGCADTLTLPNYITVNPIPQASMTAASTSLCPGTCTDFLNSSVNATSYNWSFPGATPSSSIQTDPSSICYNIPGIYDVVLVSSNGTCTDTLVSSNYITVYQQPPPPNVSQVGDTLISNSGYSSYQWYFNGNLISGATSNYYVATQSGNYNIVATDSLGCEVEAVINNVIAVNQLAVGNWQWAIFPNPVSDILEIRHLKEYSDASIKIFTIFGTAISLPPDSYRDANCKLSTCSFDVSSLPPGSYILQISNNKKVFRSRFIKQ